MPFSYFQQNRSNDMFDIPCWCHSEGLETSRQYLLPLYDISCSLTDDNLYPDFKSVYWSTAADTVIRECLCIIYVCKWEQNYLVRIVNQRQWNTSMLYNINFNNFQEIVGINKGYKFSLSLRVHGHVLLILNNTSLVVSKLFNFNSRFTLLKIKLWNSWQLLLNSKNSHSWTSVIVLSDKY